MPIDIVSIDFLDSDFSTITTGVDYLNGSIGDKLTAEIVIDVHWETPIDTPMTVSTTGIDSIDRYDGGSFISDGFKNGDSILVSIGANVLVPVTVLGTFPTKLNVSAGLSAELVPVDGIVYGVTPIQNLDFYYGIVANNVPSSTISLIDGSVQKFKSGTIIHTNTTPSSILPDTTVNSWVYDLTDQNSTIEGLGALVDINHQQFKITHEFYIQPVFRTPDLTALNTLITPTFLDNVQSLKYTFKVDGRYATTGGVIDKSTSNGNISQFIKTGDVGYFDETGNGGVADYSINSITYKDTLTNVASTSILPNTETDVIISLDSNSGAFSSTNTEFIVNVYRTPNDASTYENTTSDIKENFLVSRQSLTINDVPTVTGAGFIKAGATASYNGANEAVIEFTFEPTFFLSQDGVLNDLTAFNNDPANVADGYLIFVTCQDKTITNKGLSDKVAVLCDVNTAAGIEVEDFYNTEGVCTTTTLFNDHPTNNDLLAFTDYKGWLEDSVVTKTNIQVLKTNEQQDIGNNTIQNVWNLNNVILKIEAEHKTDPSRFFTLEESKIFVAGVDETITRNFILPIGDAQNEIIWSQAASTATHNIFDLTYPFKIRWEDWKVLFGVDSDFTTPNQDWVQYINTDWDIKVNIYKEIDLAQDLQADPSACDWTLNISGKDVQIAILTTSGSLTQWEDVLNGVTQVSNQFSYNIASDVNRDITAKIGNCLPDVESLRLFGLDAKPQGFMDLTGFTNLDAFELQGQSGVTSLQLPASGGTQMNIASNSDLFTADLSGFTGLSGSVGSGGFLLVRWNFNLDSVLLPTVAVAPTFSYVLFNSNALTSLDLTPVIQSLAATPKIDASKNKLSSADIDQIIIDVDSQPQANGILILDNQTPLAPPTAASATELANLISNGWTVTTD